MQLYYQTQGRVIGPLEEKDFLAHLDDGAIVRETRVRAEGWTEWTDLAGLLASGALGHFEALDPSPTSAQEQALRELAQSDRPLTSLPASFGDAAAKAQAYAHFLQTEYALDRPVESCVMYPTAPASTRAIFHWEGRAREKSKKKMPAWHLLLLMLGPAGEVAAMTLRPPDRPIAFQTAHDFSRSGAITFRQNRFYYTLVDGLAFISAIVAFITVVGTMVLGFLTAAAPDALDPVAHAPTALVWSSAAGLLSSGATWGLLRWARALRLPPALAHLQKAPFRLKKIGWTEFTQSRGRVF